MGTAREAIAVMRMVNAASEGDSWHFEQARVDHEEAKVRAAYLAGTIDTDEYVKRVERIYEYAQRPPEDD